MQPIDRITPPARGGLTLLLLLAVAIPSEAQRRPAPPTGTVTTPAPSRGPLRRARAWEGLAVSTEVNVTFNGRRYDRKVEAQCEFDERATPGSPRVQWNVLFPPFGVTPEPAPLRKFSLAIWNPSSSGRAAPFSFAMNADGESPMVQTYGRPAGSGTVRVRRDGPGAKFEVSGTDARGRKIAATIECSQVRKPEATGG